MTNAGRIGKTLGETIAKFEEWMIEKIMGNAMATEKRFIAWLLEHNFHRLEPGDNPVPDYAGFARWSRNSFLALWALAFCFQLYSLILGTYNDSPYAFSAALILGVLLFGAAWAVWIWLVVRRINAGLGWILGIGSLFSGAILIGLPALQYWFPTNVQSIGTDGIKGLLAAGIPRFWAILGFVLTTLVVMPFLWMLRLGPALLSLAFAKTWEAVTEVIRDIRLAFKGETASAAAELRLKKRVQGETTILMVAWVALALFTISLQLSPTVWGLYGALLICLVAIVVLWIRESNEFLGNFLTKALYGVATGGLLFICFGFGLTLATIMLLYLWSVSKLLFGLMLASLLIGIASAIGVLYNSTTAAEQEDLQNGKGHVQSYTRRVKGFNADGTPICEVAHPGEFSFGWLRSWKLWAVVVVACWLLWTQALGKPNPVSIPDFASWNEDKLVTVVLLVCAGGFLLGKFREQSS